MRRFLVSFILITLCAFSSFGHEVRPAYLGIKQVSPTEYRVLWKIPAQDGKTPRINPEFPEEWKQTTYNAELIGAASQYKWTFEIEEALPGQTIAFNGISKTLIDVLVNIEMLDGSRYSKLVKANSPFYTIPEEPSTWEVIGTYTILGIEHILFGIDHLLFVLALLFVVEGKWKLIKTITAFTLAHSITLSLAALGFASIPIAPVEAVIALSIVFLAREIIAHRKGQPSLTYQYPWLVAFTFGLLHGFGFASALSETGLPQQSIPLALLFFNVGVELGQIAFIITVLGLIQLSSKLKFQVAFLQQKTITYVIGIVSSYWLIDRVLGFWG